MTKTIEIIVPDELIEAIKKDIEEGSSTITVEMAIQDYLNDYADELWDRGYLKGSGEYHFTVEEINDPTIEVLAVEYILRYNAAIYDLSEEDECGWNYFSREDLHDKLADLNIKYINSMSDPIATWRPQRLFSWYGNFRDKKLLVVLGTDEGVDVPCAIEIGTLGDLQARVRIPEFQLILDILPEELLEDSLTE